MIIIVFIIIIISGGCFEARSTPQAPGGRIARGVSELQDSRPRNPARPHQEEDGSRSVARLRTVEPRVGRESGGRRPSTQSATAQNGKRSAPHVSSSSEGQAPLIYGDDVVSSLEETRPRRLAQGCAPSGGAPDEEARETATQTAVDG